MDSVVTEQIDRSRPLITRVLGNRLQAELATKPQMRGSAHPRLWMQRQVMRLEATHATQRLAMLDPVTQQRSTHRQGKPGPLACIRVAEIHSYLD